MHLTVADIVACCAGQLVGGPSTAEVTHLCWDSRTVQAGALYVALPGQRVDGHQFCAQAAQAGAAAVMVSQSLDAATQAQLENAGVATVMVEDSMKAIEQLAAAWRARLAGTVVALTGSSGKTTTKNMVRAVLECAGTVVATYANQNNELGVPATILSADENTEFVVVEMGMRGPGQLAALCEYVRPNWALVTNVGTSHMELLGSQDAIARAKAEPFIYLPAESGKAFINASDAFASALVEYGQLAQRGVETIYFDGSGAKPESYTSAHPSVYATDITFNAQGNASFVLRTPSSSAPCQLQLAGVHNVHNAMAAAAIGAAAGLEAKAISQALQTCQPERGRQAVLHTPNGACIIDDSYNANPDSMLASLASFASMQVEGRRIVVVGEMKELGAFEQEGHELVGQRIAEIAPAFTICVGPLAQTIASAARQAGLDSASIQCVETAQDALVQLQGQLNEGDCVLVKASHSVGLDSVVLGLVG